MNRLTSFLVGGILFLAAAQGLQAQVNFNQIKLGSGGNVLTLVGPSTGSATYSFPVPSGSVAQVLTSSGGQTVDGTVTATVDNAVIAGLRLTPAYNDNGHTGVLHATLALGTDNAAGTMFISDGSATAKYAVLTAPSLASNQTYTLSPAGGSLVTMTGGVSGSQLWNAGDLIYASANGSAVTRLAKGGNNTVLAVDGAGAFGWTGTLPALNGSNLTNLNASNISGGTINSSNLPSGTVIANGTPAVGDMLYWNGSQWNRLPVGTHSNGEILTLVSGSPDWSAAGPGGGNTFSSINLTGASNQINLQPGGAGNAFLFSATNPGQATTVRWDDPGVASTGIVYTHNSGVQDVVGKKTFQNLGLHDSSLTSVSGTLNLNASNTSSFTILSATADFAIGKITGGYDGKMLRIYNTSGKNMTLLNGMGADSLYTYANGNIVLNANGAVSLVHDGTRWTGDSYTANNVIGTIGSSSYVIDSRAAGQTVGTTIVDQDSLQISVQGGQVWEIQGTLIVTGSASNSDMTWTVLTPTSSTQTISYSSYKASGGASSLQGANVLTTSGASLGVNVGTSTTFVDFRGLIIVATTGSIKVQFGATNGTLTMAKNSYMRATRIR